MQPHYRINHTDVFKLLIVTNITLTSSNNILPDDGDCTGTRGSCSNVNFDILLKAFLLCISW